MPGRNKLRFWAAAVVPFLFALSLTSTQLVNSVDTLHLLVWNTPQLNWAVPLFPPQPALVRTTGPTPGDAGEQGALYVPEGKGRYPGLILLSGLSARGWRNPQVETLSKSLAALHIAVYVPDLPGLGHARVTMKALGALDGDIRWLSNSAYVKSTRISLLGVCAGASLAILAAENKDTSSLVQAVVAIDPYARMRDLVEAATTGRVSAGHGLSETFAMDPWAVWALAHSTASTIGNLASRALLLHRIGAQTAVDPLAYFRNNPPPGDLSPAAGAWWRVWANRSESAFAGLYEALPATVRAELSELSPGGKIASLTVPVLVIAPTIDTAYPPMEGYRLVDGNPRMVNLTVSPLMNHVTPDLGEAGPFDLLNLWRFAYQTVATVRQISPGGMPSLF